MTAFRFKTLIAHIRFDDNGTRPEREARDENGRPTNLIAPIDQLLRIFLKNIKESFHPGPIVCVDERLAKFRGRCRFKVYNPNKPAKYGINFWMLCDVSTSYVWNVQIYEGAKGKQRERNKGKKIVMDLVGDLPKGIGVVADNKFTCIDLAKTLWKQGQTLLGTMRHNRVELPPVVQRNPKRDVESNINLFYRQHEDDPDDFTCTLTSYVPRKNKAVILLSTQHRDIVITNNKSKPQIIEDNNAGKGGVDTFDRIVASTSCQRFTRRWPMVVFFNMIDIA